MTDIPGDPTTNAVVTVGSETSSAIDVLGDHDWFKVSLAAGQTITVTVTGAGDLDTYLNIYDPTGTTILASNDDIVQGTNTNSRLTFTATTAGTYFIDVGAWHDLSVGTYDLFVEPSPAPVFTNDQIAFQLTNGYWGGDVHHWAVTQGGTITVNISTLNPGEQSLARSALQEWSDIIGVHFQEVLSGGQITFDDSEQTSGTPIAATDSSWSNGIISSAHVHISTSWVTRYGTSLYSYSFQTYIHEIGHALGLGHSGEYNTTATYPTDALFANDAWSESIMSYFDQHENTYFANRGFTVNYAVTPMVADILAMQTLYGVSTTTRPGDTTYGYHSNAGGIYDATAYPRAAYTIFDSGGNDTIDYSGSVSSQLINLNPETFSNVNGYVGNLSIARGVVIENAIGGNGADTIIGNSANNVITGNLGADTLTGGGGSDTFLDTKAGHNGDTITDFSTADKIVFSDATLSSFTFSLAGNTLTYTGGSMTLNGSVNGQFTATAAASGGVQLSETIRHAAHNDFNGDGLSDILLRNDDGTVSDWLGQANGSMAVNLVYYNIPNSWHIAGTGDFNGDGRVDLLLRNDDGTVSDWLGQANGGFAINSVYYNLPNSWHFAGTGDFNGDGRVDLLLRNDDGTVSDWLGQANGGFAINAVYYNLPNDWHIAGTGDFNGDGLSDILLRNDDGTVSDWLGQANGGFAINPVYYDVPTSWQIVGTGDFNGDGRSDVLWRNNDGTVTDWLSQPGGGLSSNPVYANIPTNWHIVGTGDFNGDAIDDILVRNDAGQVVDWLGQANGGFVSNADHFSANVPLSWHIEDPFVHFL